MSTTTRLISYEDSLSMPENRFEEIVHGESRIMPPATILHNYLIEVLAEALRRQLDPREYYVTCGNGLGIERNPLTYRIPDLAVFCLETSSRTVLELSPRDPYIWAVPDLIVECLSPSNRKGSIAELLANYAQIAVPEVWLLDAQVPRCTSYYCESGALHEHQTVNTGAVSPRLLRGVTIDLADLWAAFKRGPFLPKR